MNKKIRTFKTGATRNLEGEKLDYEAFLSSTALKRFATYMHKNRHLEDGTLRDGDNWKKGFPIESFMKSGWRHFFTWWDNHRNPTTDEEIEEALCGLMFNTMGYLREYLKKKK